MKDATTGKTSKDESATDWERLRSRSDAELRAAINADTDAPGTEEAFWKDAKVVWPRRKETVTIRLDADLLAWLRRESGYQTRINAVLRAYMKANTARP